MFAWASFHSTAAQNIPFELDSHDSKKYILIGALKTKKVRSGVQKTNVYSSLRKFLIAGIKQFALPSIDPPVPMDLSITSSRCSLFIQMSYLTSTPPHMCK